jgi:hypothetical protein
MESTDQNRCTIYLGGIWDKLINKGLYQPTAAPIWGTAFDAYMTILTKNQVPTALAANWGFLSLNKNNGAYPRVQIANITLDAGTPTTLTVTTVQNHNVPNPPVTNLTGLNSVVRMSYVPNNSPQTPFNQLYQVFTWNSPTSLTLAAPNWTNPGAFLSRGKGGYLQNMVKTFFPYTTYGVPVARTRKRGVTANLPLGRFKRRAGVGY